MGRTMPDVTFGPVPSRRLGQSLGINNIPPKACTYSCVYCQIGATRSMRVKRRAFHDAATLVDAVRVKVDGARSRGEVVDYLTFVPDGEPTLDLYLGWELWQLSRLGIRTAVITNATLLWQPEVREDLLGADWVSLKIDSVRENTWRAINRPHRSLRLGQVLEGIREFARDFSGQLTTETMVVGGINDEREELDDIARFIGEIAPDRSYLSVPTRPPAVKSVGRPTEQSITEGFASFKQRIENVEYLVGYEGNAFASSGSPESDLLSITAVHPMKLQAVCRLLERAGSDWSVVQNLLDSGDLVETAYCGDHFYTRSFSAPEEQ